MKIYALALRLNLVKKMLGSQGQSAHALSKEVGIPQPTLSRWLRQAQREGDGPREERRPLVLPSNQVWSWEITYLRTCVKGQFFYLYVVLDVWSRNIVGWTVSEAESSDPGAALVAWACDQEDVQPGSLVLHSDNGGPMRGSTMLATLERLGGAASFNRPGVSNDNPFSEALFRTVKYRPEYPSRPFDTLAKAWAEDVVWWYN